MRVVNPRASGSAKRRRFAEPSKARPAEAPVQSLTSVCVDGPFPFGGETYIERGRNGGVSMIDLTREERDYLTDVLESEHKEMLHELHHTDTRDFERTLRQRLAVNEGLKFKLQREMSAATPAA
jgi:hypothetical protein